MELLDEYEQWTDAQQKIWDGFKDALNRFKALSEDELADAIKSAVEKALAERQVIEQPPRGEQAQDGLKKLGETLIDNQNKRELEFPVFPTDLSMYFDWLQRGKNWFDLYGRDLKPIVRLQKVKDACDKSDAASMITRKYQMHNNNYQPCMNELNRRFNMARKVAFGEVGKLISLMDGSATKYPKLQHVYDVATAAKAIIDAVATADAMETPLPAGKSLELKIMESKYNVLFTALIYRALDSATRTHIASRLDLSLSRIPPANDVLVRIERRFIVRQEAETNTPNELRDNRKEGNFDACLLCDETSHETRACPKLFNPSRSTEV